MPRSHRSKIGTAQRKPASGSRSQQSNSKRKRRRWVIKAGSQMVCGGGPLLLRAWMNQVAELKKHHGIEVIWVTSGAISSAVDRTDFKPKHGQKRTLPEKQALSAIGQPMVMELYNLALHACGLLGAQVLLTADDIQNKKRRVNLQNSLNTLLEWGTVPILNENDAVAVEEIQFGDNDSLSAKIAMMMNAERLILLTDVDGLFSADPKVNPQAKLIHELTAVTAGQLKAVSQNATSQRGTGGMYSKLLAGKSAAQSGIETHLVRGDHPRNLIEIFKGQPLGTRILARPVDTTNGRAQVAANGPKTRRHQ